MSTTTKQQKRLKAAERLRERRAAERRRKRLITTATIAALLLIVGLIGYGIYQAQKPEKVSYPTVAVDSGTGLSVGDGPVTVDLYVDFLCPGCRAYEQQATPAIDEYLENDRITLVYHPVNFLDELTSTKYSTRAAAAAAIAAEHGKLKEYAAALFAHQPPERSVGLSDDELIDIGRKVGLTSPDFAEAVRSDKYHDWVSYVAREADKRGVRGTPTVMVDGKAIEPSVGALRTAVDAAK